MLCSAETPRISSWQRGDIRIEVTTMGMVTPFFFGVWCILHDVNTGLFHPAMSEWHDFCSQSDADIKSIEVVRLRSRMHHTGGFATFEEAVANLHEVAPQTQVPEENVIYDEAFDWDGVWPWNILVPNWKRDGMPSLPELLRNSFK